MAWCEDSKNIDMADNYRRAKQRVKITETDGTVYVGYIRSVTGDYISTDNKDWPIIEHEEIKSIEPV